ncbi:PEP/pyruvate-binding domain-containing protein [Methanoculleus frigidifontis]|nr:PEP/pyruvate-binding domain-containing protein [Methanoculleus sp. FWC-SCC1]
MEDDTQRLATFGYGVQEDLPASVFGNKAANLARMAALGIPVPPGFSLNVSICEDYFRNGETFPSDIPRILDEGVAFLERATGQSLGSLRRPLLVSVRSGAPVSMPGMMETLLNVGLSRRTIRGLILQTGNPRFAWDSYRRLLENFGTVACGQDPAPYRSLLADTLAEEGVPDEAELDAASLRNLCGEYERHYLESTGGAAFPVDVRAQILMAVAAVIRSWMSPRAEAFRRLHPMGDLRGTAVVVQAMVFGNMGADSGAGVAFTRNPWSGENEFLLDFKFGAQGEDVVSGEQAAVSCREFSGRMPAVYENLSRIGRTLEMHFGDMQDIEFTVQKGVLYILQSRAGKRTPLAALRIAVEACNEGLLSRDQALALLEGLDLDAITLQKVVADEPSLGAGTSASTGVATGSIVFSSDRAQQASAGGPVILVRETASTDDLRGISASDGILVARGARTSHAAVVARQMGKICIVNCTGLAIDERRRRCTLGGHELREGDVITLDGDTGLIYRGRAGILHERPESLLAAVRAWTDSRRG